MKFNIFNACLIAAASFVAPTAMADGPGDTKYPVVLVHGLGGDADGYFYQIASNMADVGTDQIFAPQVTEFENNFVRGEELLSYVEDVIAVTGASKVNLIGHSQGGMTARYVASTRPDLVASVTSVGTPHFGSDTADLVAAAPDFLVGTVAEIVDGFTEIGNFFSGDSGSQQDSRQALEALSSAGAANFNAIFPQGLRSSSCREVPRYNANTSWWGWAFPNWVYDYSVNDGAHKVNGVRYYSWMGTYNPALNSNPLDFTDVALGVTWWTHDTENDGVVERCSSHLGDIIRDDYTLNHIDQINGTLGLRGLGTSNPVTPYVNHVQRLKNRGL